MNAANPIKQILCIGSINYDILLEVPRMPRDHEKLPALSATYCGGGSAANTAYWLARLGNTVSMVGCVGDDLFGSLALEELRHAGVQLLVDTLSHESTGIAMVLTNSSSKRMITTGAANRQLRLDIRKYDISARTHVHVSSPNEAVVVPFLEEVRNIGATVSCEFNGLTSLTRASLCDFAFMNHSELAAFQSSCSVDEFTKVFLDRWLVVTHGSHGATAMRGDEKYVAPAVPTTVVDRTGGGDAFDAGFLSAVLAGKSIQSALKEGLRLASRILAIRGARMGIDIRELAS